MRWFLASVLALSFAAPMALSAQKPKANKERPPDGQAAVIFNDAQRQAAGQYFVKQYGRGNCPPGLAKKQNGCLPPGQAKKRYVVGHPLPPGLVPGNLPTELTVRLGPAPEGYLYAMVDGDLVKLAVGSLLVVDAIEGLVR